MAASGHRLTASLFSRKPALLHAHFEPPGPAGGKSIDGAVVTSPAGQHRLILDRSRKRYFGYDLYMEHPGRTEESIYVRHIPDSQLNETFVLGAADAPEYVIHE